MPQFIRLLPCKSKSPIIDKNSTKDGIDYYNPSRSENYIYTRITKRTNNTFVNSAILHNTLTNKSFEIDSPWNLLQKSVNIFKGIEDLRIVNWNGNIWFAGTCTHATDHMINNLIIGYFKESNGGINIQDVQAVDIGSLPVKNVCPFVYNERLCLLDIGLMKIYTVKIDLDGKILIDMDLTVDMTFGSGLEHFKNNKFRGSTTPIH